MRVATIYHAGRDSSHRERQRALVRAGVEMLLVVPESWPGPDEVHAEPFEIAEVPMWRAGSVNAHALRSPHALADRLRAFRPDVVDIHAEPFSLVARQVLGLVDPRQAAVAYTAQNIDKRFPPPFAQWERRALGRLTGLYPCSQQAASVAVGKGYRGPLSVLPLGVDPEMTPGHQDPPEHGLDLLLVGRLVAEKGVADAVRVLAALHTVLPTTLTIVGEGPERDAAMRLARTLGVGSQLNLEPWVGPSRLAQLYRGAHVVLVPSRTSPTWVEQFGRVVVEAQACGAVVVAYASGSLPEVVGAGGVLVDEADVARLTAAVAGLVHDPRQWLDLRRRGFERASGCTWDAIADRQLGLYTEALSSPARSTRVRPDRTGARARFGRPAEVIGTLRPFATPIPKADSRTGRMLGALIDAYEGRR